MSGRALPRRSHTHTNTTWMGSDMGNREQSSERRKPAPRPIGRDDWERILAAAANGETGLRPIARAARVHTSTVKRAMDVGWPERGLPPVSEALAMRRATGRALAEALPEVKFDADGVTPAPREPGARRAPLRALPSRARDAGEPASDGGRPRRDDGGGHGRASSCNHPLRNAGGITAGTMDIEVAVQCLGRLVDVEGLRRRPARADEDAPARAGTARRGQRPVFATVEEAVAVLDRTRQAARARALGLVPSPWAGNGWTGSSLSSLDVPCPSGEVRC
jgi:hypothetical protein